MAEFCECQPLFLQHIMRTILINCAHKQGEFQVFSVIKDIDVQSKFIAAAAALL